MTKTQMVGCCGIDLQMSSSSYGEQGLGLGFEEIMMIINHVTEGMISDHVIGGQKIIRFVIRFDYAYLGKVLSASVMDRWAS